MRTFHILGSCALLFACNGGDIDDRPDIQVSDSGGISIVTTIVNSVEDLPFWTIEYDTILIGSEVEDIYQIFRAMDIEVMEDGRVLVANGDATILEFTRDGDLRTVHGGRGQGPGEFLFPLFVEATGDGGFLVFDRYLDHHVANRFGPDGTYLDRTRVNPDVWGNVLPIGLMSGESILLRVEQTTFLNPPKQDTTFFGWVEVPGGEWSELLRSPSGTSYSITVNGEREIGEAPFSPTPWAAVADSTVVVIDGQRYEVNQVSPEGLPLRRYRISVEPPIVDQRLRDEFTEERALFFEGRSPDVARMYRQTARDIPYEETVPTYDRIIAGSEGRIWIREINVFFWRTDVSETWQVIDHDGRFAGRVALPQGFRFFEARGDSLYGIGTDSIGLPVVRMLRVRRP